MTAHFRASVDQVLGNDKAIRILHVQHFAPGSPLLPTIFFPSYDDIVVPVASKGVSVVKFFIRTTGKEAPSTPCPTAGTDVGIELWFPDPGAWNERVYVQILGGMMGDFRVTSKAHSSANVCTERTTPELASDMGYVVASTDGGHIAESVEDMQYLLNNDGTYNLEGFKNVAWQACHLTVTKAKEISRAYYSRDPRASYLYGCSTGGRQAYHSAQKFPDDFDGIIASCPSITQSLLFPSLGHPHIVAHNDLNGQSITPEQLEIVAQKAQAAGDTAITGSHDGYITVWDKNFYDATKDLSIISTAEGGECIDTWGLSKAQCQAINKIWYGPTITGDIPDPAEDNGAGYKRPEHQLWWGKIRGTRIEFANTKRDIIGNLLALVYKDPKLAPPFWDHPLGKGENGWANWTHRQYGDAMLKSQQMDREIFQMDADNPDLRTFQESGNKILAYHGLADQGVAPQSAVAYYQASAEWTGGLDKTKQFHRLFLIPGMGHCLRSRGSAGRAMIPIPTVEQMLQAAVSWVEDGIAPEKVVAFSHDNTASRPIFAYPRLPKYDGKGDVNSAESFS